MNPAQLPSIAPAQFRPAGEPDNANHLVVGMAQGDGLDDLAVRFLASIVPLAGARAGAVRVLSDDNTKMRLVAQLGLSDAVLATEELVDRHCGVCGLAAASDALQWTDDLRGCARHNQGLPFGAHSKRVLAMSLRHGGEVLGVFNLFFDTDAPVSPEADGVLRMAGELLGLVLHNARNERERLRVTVMQERQALVHEVHDAIAQTLVYVKMRLPLLHDAILAHDDQRSIKYLTDVKHSVKQVHDNLREVMTYFRTRMDPLGLLHALQETTAGFHDRTGIALEIKNPGGALHLSEPQEVEIFHIVQEALANIAKHSCAKKAWLEIRRSADELEFLVEDDGAGMADAGLDAELPASDVAVHFGMEIMQVRARRLGGGIEVRRNEVGGTCVRLRVPRSHPGARLSS